MKENYPLNPQLFQQPAGGFHRVVENTFEHVDYLKGSTIRIWYNDDTCEYSTHWHTATEIILPVVNDYMVKVNQTSYHLNAGDILLIPSGEQHALSAPASGSRFIYLFDFSTVSKLKGFASILPLLSAPYLITPQTAPRIYEAEYALLLEMRDEYFSGNTLRELVIYSMIISFFVQIGRDHLEQTIENPYVRTNKKHEYIETFNDVLDYIDHHYMEDLNLETVAGTAGFSKYYFTRLFKQYTDTTFYDYLSFKRIRVAESLLSRAELSVTEIALQSGFSSISTFNRIFKKLKKCSPTQYREIYSSGFRRSSHYLSCPPSCE